MRGGSRSGWNRGNGLKSLNVIICLPGQGSLSVLEPSLHLGLIHHNTELPVTDQQQQARVQILNGYPGHASSLVVICQV